MGKTISRNLVTAQVLMPELVEGNTFCHANL